MTTPTEDLASLADREVAAACPQNRDSCPSIGNTRHPWRVYVAGPYSGASKTERDANIARADEAGRELLARGYLPFVPHKMTACWDEDDRFTRGDFMALDLEYLVLCHAILMLPNWRNSEGARIERATAEGRGMMIFEGIDSVPDLKASLRGDV